ncbi:MAG: hypothetical protein IPM37_12435 [Hahellaceae bacterium]|nr:hypothetical protein [Hahellaceae bacterium]
MDTRYHALCQWVAQQLNEPQVELSVVSGDASFRRYFRYTRGSESWIAMDAPPDKEDSTRFVAIAQSWFAQGIHVPEIKALSMEEGFMLLSDFGSSLLLASFIPISPIFIIPNAQFSKANTITRKQSGILSKFDPQRMKAFLPSYMMRPYCS